ncbi:energy-coupling factor ABC transporter ATP-binding protein [Sedimentibacter hydroxybenzoicus DSM 7310]|uniref:ABC transporter ATP-binding protein n=1 Tax=Sedimentibacter hydroxybenzoicus DSM 7310 TaxID=1123245 RepID=A0A974BKL1_SEDHY|nr:energy-coupling factor ABC transporter ATP-binding protein [Sedimentibacter hydroxybenzoicus]NYB75029.1 energy-coupling factor ABC transporter ATP-binding protein [Sedimentibacter hydroxybenzoicus DSM 7310]
MLRMEDVTYIYEDGTVALKDVNIDLKKGAKIGIVGSNGSGKSTLFMIFLGLFKPTKGRVLFNEKELKYDKRTLSELRKNTGIVFQDPDKQIFFSSVFDDVAFALRNLKFNEDEVQKRVKLAMEKTGITELQNKPVHFLSYGQKKNVSIAGVAAMNHNIIFFDEPTAGLDYRSQENVKSILENLSEKQEKSIVVSSHDMNFIYEACDYIYVLNKGQLLSEGKKETIFLNKEILDKAGLEEPFLVKVHKYLGKELYKNESELFSD